MSNFNTSMKSYQIAMESFASMAIDQPPSERLNYRSAAMEAIAGPDSGMVLDNLYKNVMARSSVNFGKIPDSQGELTRFAKYKSIADSISLLERQMGQLNVKELKATRELHDNLIRLRDDFVYGYKVDSQFLKTTYCTMVYALCEITNLCGVIYIDMLKCQAEGRPYKPEDYSFLILVQNVEKFNGMVKSGEWATMVLSIRKDARNLVISVDSGDDGNFLSTLSGIIGSGGGLAIAKKYLTPSAQDIATGAGHVITNKKGAIADPHLGDYAKAAGKAFVKAKLPAKIVVIIGILIAVLFLIRNIIALYWKGVYKLDEVLKDNEALLRAHMDKNAADPSGTTMGAEKQLALYNQLSSLHDGIRTRIMKADSEGRKALKESNAKDFNQSTFTPPVSVGGDDDFAIV